MRQSYPSQVPTKTAVQSAGDGCPTSSAPLVATVPVALADVALIDASAAAAAGSMSLSWWHAEVAARRAPQPAVRRPRCTRWRAVEVAQFWRDFGSQPDDGAAAAVKSKAAVASAAARAKRRTATGGTAQVEV